MLDSRFLMLDSGWEIRKYWAREEIENNIFALVLSLLIIWDAFLDCCLFVVDWRDVLFAE